MRAVTTVSGETVPAGYVTPPKFGPTAFEAIEAIDVKQSNQHPTSHLGASLAGKHRILPESYCFVI